MKKSAIAKTKIDPDVAAQLRVYRQHKVYAEFIRLMNKGGSK